jgi:hypothetical protein
VRRLLLRLRISPGFGLFLWGGFNLDWGKLMKLVPLQQCLLRVICAVDATASPTFFLGE